MNNVEGFLNMVRASYNLYLGQINGKRYIERQYFAKDMKFYASDGSASWIYSTDAARKEVKRWAVGERRAVLFAAGKMLHVCDVQIAFILSVCANCENSGV